MIRFTLPWPPSINNYYMRTAKGVVLGKRGRDYRAIVKSQLVEFRNSFNANAKLSVTINLYQPDKRKRDIDNVAKAVLDSLQHAEVFKDDNQIDMLTIIRREPVKGGCAALWITECS